MESCTALAVEHTTLEACSKETAALRIDDSSDLQDGGVTTPVRLSRDNTRTWSDDDSETSAPNTPGQTPAAAECPSERAEAAAQVEAEHRATLALLQQKLERERRELFEAIAETRRLREALSAAEADRNRLQVQQKQMQTELDASRRAACELRRELDHEIYRRRFFQALSEELKS